jgi:hypothetical protein
MSQDIMMIAAQEIQLKSSLRSSNLNLQRPGFVSLQRTSVGGQSFSEGKVATKKVGKNKSTKLDSISYLHKFQCCCGSVTFWYGLGFVSGSSDPYLCLTDPDADPGGPKTFGLRRIWMRIRNTGKKS